MKGQGYVSSKPGAFISLTQNSVDQEKDPEDCRCGRLRGSLPGLFAQRLALNPSWLTPIRVASRKISLKTPTISSNFSNVFHS